MLVQVYNSRPMIHSFSPVFTQEETHEILSSESGIREPTIGGYEEYTIDLKEVYVKKVGKCVTEYLKSLEIRTDYIYKCSRIANITGPINRHSDLEVHLEPKHYIRNFIVVTYLTEFEGGEIVFPQHALIFKPKIGDTLIFPSGPYFQHLVNPAIGKRVIMRSEYYLNLNYRGSEVDRTIWK